MLHFNHWVTKARGNEIFWKNLYTEDLALYRSLFINCDHTLVDSYFKGFIKKEQQELKRAFSDYQQVRNQYLTAKEGVATVEEVSRTVIRYTFNPLQRPAIVLGTVSNSDTGRHYRVIDKDLLYEGNFPFSKKALMFS